MPNAAETHANLGKICTLAKEDAAGYSLWEPKKRLTVAQVHAALTRDGYAKSSHNAMGHPVENLYRRGAGPYRSAWASIDLDGGRITWVHTANTRASD